MDAMPLEAPRDARDRRAPRAMRRSTSRTIDGERLGLISQ